MARYFQDETDAFNRAATRDAYNAAYDGDEARAQAVVDYHNEWPQMNPGTKLVLAKAGVPKDSPTAIKAAQLSEKRKARKGGIGDIIRAGSGKIGKVLGATGDVASTVTKGVVRTGFAAISAPFEEATGLLRTAAGTIGGRAGGLAAGAGGGAALGAAAGAPFAGIGALPGAIAGGAIGGVLGFLGGDDIKGEGGLRSQSTFGQAIGNLVKKGEFDVGAGYFPGGKAHERAAAEARKTATIAGKGLTLGRLTANVPVISEPGSRAYNILSGLIDFGSAIKLDPAALAGAKLAKVNGARRTILSEKAGQEILSSQAGAQLFDDLAKRGNAWEIWNLAKGQLPVETAVALRDETNPARIRELLAGELGVTVRARFGELTQGPAGTGEVGRGLKMRAEAKRLKRLENRRWTVNLPVGQMEWDKPAEFVTKMDGLLANAKITGEERLKVLDKTMTMLAGPREGRMDHLAGDDGILTALFKVEGLSPEASKALSKILPESIEDMRKYTAMEQALNSRVPGLAIDADTGRAVITPQIPSEMMDTALNVPTMQDLRRIRQDLGKLSWAFDKPVLGEAMRGSDIIMTGLLNKVWKAGVLLRLAIIPRVAGEEQVRMSAAGYDSIFNNPLSYIMGVMGRKGTTGVTGEKIQESRRAQEALTNRHAADGFMEQSGVLRTRGRNTYTSANPSERADFLRGWRDHELGHLRGDSLSQHIARHGPEATKDWLETGAGQKILKELWQQKPKDPTFMRSRVDIETYIDDVVAPRVQEFTRGDEDLLNYVRQGQGKTDAAEKAAKEAIAPRLEAMLDEGQAPAKALADVLEYERMGPGNILDKVISWMFGMFMEKPTNMFNRSQTFNQAYWKRSIERVEDLTQADQVKLLANAREAKLSKAQIDEIKSVVDDPLRAGTADLDDVDFISQGFALEEVRDLLYDLSKKGMSSDALRLLMPFAEPWREMMTTWSKLIVENPQFVRRFQQTVEGARGAGFFTTDEQTGEEMFAYPGSSFLTKHLVGIPTPLKGRVAGLNLFAQNPLYPGFGPLVQIGAGALIDDKPEFDWARDAINPFGRSDEPISEQLLLPGAWIGKLRQAFADPESDRLFGNTVYDISRYLVSTGDYTIDSVEEQERTTKAAMNMAKKMYLLRAAASFSAPAAPSPEFQSALKDPSGKTLTQFKLIDEFRKLQEDPEVGFENAVDTFLDKYGDEALLYMQPKTQGGGPAVDDMQEWIRNNPELPSRFPEVYHFFGPRTGEFSYTAYERQLATGERKQISPAEALKLGNNRVAMMQWRKAKEKVGTRPNQVQKQWLDNLKTQLLDQYPGWEPEPKDIGKFQRNTRQLQEALEDPKLAKTETGQALEIYFLARDKANEQAKAAGFSSFAKAKAMVGTRRWLRDIADQLIDDTPDFEAVWEQVLNKEMAEDEPEVEFPLEEE